jgi:hypothetical protein
MPDFTQGFVCTEGGLVTFNPIMKTVFIERSALFFCFFLFGFKFPPDSGVYFFLCPF